MVINTINVITCIMLLLVSNIHIWYNYYYYYKQYYANNNNNNCNKITNNNNNCNKNCNCNFKFS